MADLMKVYADFLGHDTEYFLWDTKKDKVVPSYKYFKPKKEEQEFTPGNTKNIWGANSAAEPAYPLLRKEFRGKHSLTMNSGQPFRVYRDGLAVEVNSYPVTCRAWVWQDMKLALATALSVKNIPNHVRFTSRPWVKVPHQLMRHFPDDLKVLGCNPTFDAYTEKQKVILKDPMKLYFRTSGAHLHTSFSSPQPEENWAPIIKLADLLVGVPFTYIFGDELEFKRRELYGQAGEFRFQQYPTGMTGLEYRVLSSRLYNHPAIFGLFSGIWHYIVCVSYVDLWKLWDKAWEDDICEAINLGTPEKFPALLNVVAELLSKVGNRYRMQVSKTGMPAGVEFWSTLKQLHARGTFPDAGIVNNLAFPEAHKGWSEYARTWKL